MPTNVDKHFQKEWKNLEFRAEYALFDIAEKLSEQIRAGREAKGLSQKQLADLLETHQSQVSRLEDPLYTRYSLLTLAEVADVLGCRLDVGFAPAVQITLPNLPIPEGGLISTTGIPPASAMAPALASANTYDSQPQWPFVEQIAA